MNRTEIKEWVEAQDWSFRDTEIARKTGIPLFTVRSRRIKAGIPKGTISTRPGKWADVDWTKPDAAIAAERNVTRQCVNFYRKRYAQRNAN
jgi:hypothetical protein